MQVMPCALGIHKPSHYAGHFQQGEVLVFTVKDTLSSHREWWLWLRKYWMDHGDASLAMRSVPHTHLQ